MGQRAAQILAALGLVLMLAGGVGGACGMWISEEVPSNSAPRTR
jgi:hypothetical protein